MSATFVRHMAAGVLALVGVAAMPVQALAYTDPVTHWDWIQTRNLETAAAQGYRLATAQEFAALVEHAGYSLSSPSASGQGQDYAASSFDQESKALLGFNVSVGIPLAGGDSRDYSFSILQSDGGPGLVLGGLSFEYDSALLPCDTDPSGLCYTDLYHSVAGVGSEAYFRASTHWGIGLSDIYDPLPSRLSYAVVRAVPEPRSIALLLAGLGVVAVMRRRRA